MNNENVVAPDEAAARALAALCCERAATYRLLARFFAKELDADFLTMLRAMRLPAGSGNKSLDEGYRLIARYVGSFWDDSFTESAVDFSRTFVGYGMDGHSAAYPYESVYTSEKRLTMQDSRDDVLRRYREQGFERSEATSENEDHLSIELEFMGALAERASRALSSGEESRAAEALTVQRDFLRDHLMNWIEPFAADMRRFAGTDLYQGVAHLVEGFLVEDAEFLNDVVFGE